jgi:hypothetical protein
MAIKYTNLFNCKPDKKSAQIGIFCLKICHLATLFLDFSSLDQATRAKACSILTLTYVIWAALSQFCH